MVHLARLTKRARAMYVFRDEYIFDLEKSVVVEVPQAGHATYVFTKPDDVKQWVAWSKPTPRSKPRSSSVRIGFAVSVGDIRTCMLNLLIFNGLRPETTPSAVSLFGSPCRWVLGRNLWVGRSLRVGRDES
jgi:hypothetical protein